jgi:hypothetical protein
MAFVFLIETWSTIPCICFWIVIPALCLQQENHCKQVRDPRYLMAFQAHLQKCCFCEKVVTFDQEL